MSKYPLQTIIVNMEHESGSKFYQAVSIWNDDIEVGVHFRRWGAVGTKGQIKIFSADSSPDLSFQMMNEIVSKKTRRGYSVERDFRNFYGVSQLTKILKEEVSCETETIKNILHKLGFEPSGELERSGKPDNPIVVEEVEIDRGVEWASW